MDRIILVTGATSGIGLATAEDLAARGWHVLGVGRSRERWAAADAEIRSSCPDARLTWFEADLSALKSVDRLADEVTEFLGKSAGGRLDVLLNNAGCVRDWYTATEDGYEMQFAVNYLAGYRLTRRLLPCLEKSAVARVLTVSSASHRGARIHWNDLMNRKRYSCLQAYKQSKLCNVLFTAEWNRRNTGFLVRAYAVDPGLVDTAIGSKNTGGLVSWFWQLRRQHGLSPHQAAATIVWLCKMPPGWQTEDVYFRNCRPDQPSRSAMNEAYGRRLWALSEKLSGMPVPG